MARRKTQNTPAIPEKKPSLLFPRAQVEEKLQDRIQKGKDIQATQINSIGQLSTKHFKTNSSGTTSA